MDHGLRGTPVVKDNNKLNESESQHKHTLTLESLQLFSQEIKYNLDAKYISCRIYVSKWKL